jgi:hypothetical protein
MVKNGEARGVNSLVFKENQTELNHHNGSQKRNQTVCGLGQTEVMDPNQTKINIMNRTIFFCPFENLIVFFVIFARHAYNDACEKFN